jgi:hypothetical protein
MDLDAIERKHLEDIGAFEREVALKADRMSLGDIDAELRRLPASPRTDRDILARAAMTKRRFAILDAQRPHPNAPPPDPAGMCEVNIPPGGATCIQSRKLRSKFFYAEERDGRLVVRLPWDEFRDIANSTHVSGSGPNGASWWASNPHLANRLPKNPQPPLPEYPR